MDTPKEIRWLLNNSSIIDINISSQLLKKITK